MRVLIVYCHPDPESFTSSVRTVAERALTAAAHEVRVADLYAEKFDPVMSRDERAAYHTAGSNERLVESEIERIKWAEALVFVYPTWWYGQPAMLKGWLDRVWVPHVTFTMPTATAPIARKMTNIRALLSITTLGSPRWWWAIVGAPGRRVLMTGIAALCHPRVKRRWIALHSIDNASLSDRQVFLTRVETEMGKLQPRP